MVFLFKQSILTLAVASPLRSDSLGCRAIKRLNHPSDTFLTLTTPLSPTTASASCLICLRVFPYPALATSTKKLDNSVSSEGERYGNGPGFLPWTTLPETLSLSVCLGTPCSFAALKTGVPFLTAFKASSIASSVHCFLFLVVLGLVSRWGGADLDLGLSRLHFFFDCFPGISSVK